MKKIKTTRYLLEKCEPRSSLDVSLHGNKWMEKGGAIIKKQVELTEDDYGLILDALYEQAKYHEFLDKVIPKEIKSNKSAKVYANSLKEVAKKFEKIFGGK